MDLWTEIPELPPEFPSTRDGGDSDGAWSPAPGQPENLSIALAPCTTKPVPPSNVTDGSEVYLCRAGAVEASARPDAVGIDARLNPLCSRNYLVLARLFKLHPGFDAAIEGILSGDAGECVVLTHETRDEVWTRVVWCGPGSGKGSSHKVSVCSIHVLYG